ncbi:hypothetical protein OROMI_004117 [Orobanche minor]
MVKILPKRKLKNRPINILIPFSRYKKILTYRKLPKQLLELSVLKLDGFHVARNATVASLQLAIEEEFCVSSNDGNERLWSLVWSHFCLCYKDQRLVSERACIRKYGINSGDQGLHFVPYLRIDLAPTPRQSKYRIVDSKHFPMTNARHISIDDQNADLEYSGHEEDSMAFLVPKSKLTHCLKGLLSCSRLQCSKRENTGMKGLSFKNDVTL